MRSVDIFTENQEEALYKDGLSNSVQHFPD